MRKATRTDYDELPLIPSLLAESVCQCPYTGEEISLHSRSLITVEKIEKLRQAMTDEQVREFADACDKKCREAYEAQAEWFEECVTAKDNRERDQLRIWVSHWLSAYLMKARW